jgi:hypothetical protein
VTEIKRKVDKQRKRKALFRFLQAESDKGKITTWKSELTSILHLFTVRSVVFSWSPLTVLFQAKVVMNTSVEVTGIRKILEGVVQPVSASCIQSVEN